MWYRKIKVSWRRAMHAHGALQLGIIMALWALGELAVRLTGLPLPGGVVGMFLALALFASHRLSPASMRRAADWLLAEMLLFFTPLVLAVLEHKELLSILGLKVLATILLGTVAVMAATAITADLMFRLRGFGENGHDAR